MYSSLVQLGEDTRDFGVKGERLSSPVGSHQRVVQKLSCENCIGKGDERKREINSARGIQGDEDRGRER